MQYLIQFAGAGVALFVMYFFTDLRGFIPGFSFGFVGALLAGLLLMALSKKKS